MNNNLRHFKIKEQIKRIYKSNNTSSKKKFFPRKAHLTRSINALKKYCSDFSIDVNLKYTKINNSISNIVKNRDITEIELAIDILSKYKSTGYSYKNKSINHVINILNSHLA
jgi:hypothetical protein